MPRSKGKSAAKAAPTSREELSKLTRDELVDLAEKRGVTVTRADGEEGEPLVDDYIAALATRGVAGRRQTVVHRLRDAQGNPVNEDGERVNARGDVIDAED